MKNASSPSSLLISSRWTAVAILLLGFAFLVGVTSAQGEPPPENNGSGTQPKPEHHQGKPPTTNTPPGGLVTPFRPKPEPEPEPPAPEPTPNPTPNPSPNPTPNPTPVPTPRLPSVAPVTGPGGATVPPSRTPTTQTPKDLPPSGRWRGRTQTVSLENWETWWRYNRDAFIIRSKYRSQPVSTSQDTGVFLGELRPGKGTTPRPAMDMAYVRQQVIPVLQEAMRDRSPTVRTAACIALGKVGTAEHVPVLVDRLKDSTRFVREAAALGLGLLEQESAQPPLLAILKADEQGCRLRGDREPETALRAVAALALGLTGHDPSDAVKKALMRVSGHLTAHRDLTLLATMGLGAMKAPSQALKPVSWHLKSLASRRRDVNDWVRAQAVTGIARLVERNGGGDDVRTLTGLARLMISDRGAYVRQSAITALGQATQSPDKRNAAVRALLNRYRKAPSSMERHLAAVALGRLGGDEAYSALVQGVKEGGRSLNRVYSAFGLAILMRTVQERTTAGKACDLSHGFACLRSTFLREKNVSVRAGLALALGIARDREAGPVLLKTLRTSANPEFRSYVGLALGMLEHEPAAADLTNLILHTRDAVHVKERLAVGLGIIGVKNLLPLLSALKNSRSGYELEAILRALGLVGDHAVVKPLAALANDERAQIRTRATACLALGVLGDPHLVPVLASLRAGHNYLAASDTVNALLTRDL